VHKSLLPKNMTPANCIGIQVSLDHSGATQISTRPVALETTGRKSHGVHGCGEEALGAALHALQAGGSGAHNCRLCGKKVLNWHWNQTELAKL